MKEQDINSLKRIMVKKPIDSIYTEELEKLPVSDFIKAVRKAESKGKRKGFVEIRLQMEYEHGDEDTLPRHCCYVEGWREETEEEWHSRLERNKNISQRTIENAQKIVERRDHYLQRAVEIDTALSNSSLKCEVCHGPCSSVLFANGKKRRMHYNCFEKTQKTLDKIYGRT